MRSWPENYYKSMAIEAHYDFTEGSAAKYLKEKLNLKFETFRNIRLKEITGLSANKVKFEGGYSFYIDGEDKYLMFHYKKYCFTFWRGVKSLPKYHPFNCKTMQEFSGFVFSNKMPVSIHSKDEHRTYVDQDLSLCFNCRKEIFRSWFGGGDKWFDAVLRYVEQQESPTFKKDGYHTMWSQISEAYREKANWKCESCSIDLSNPKDRQHLHTHHKSGNTKDNTVENLKALCLLCHALEHKSKLKNGTGFFEVAMFVKKHADKLSEQKIRELEILRIL